MAKKGDSTGERGKLKGEVLETIHETTVTVRHEYTTHSRHRIVVDGVPGDWTVYEHVAFWPKESGDEDKIIDSLKFIAFTPYYFFSHSAVYATKLVQTTAVEDDNG